MRYLILFLALFSFFSCSQDKGTIEDSFDLNIRLIADPGMINAFYKPTSLGREVYQYMFTPLADYHPDNLELLPILIEDIPKGSLTERNGQQLISYDITIRDDAKWPDGTPLSAMDYLFTISMIKHPSSKITAWKPYFAAMKKIELDENNPRKLTVLMDTDYMLSLETAVTINVLPYHKYDKNKLLVNNAENIFQEDYSTTDSIEINIVESVNQSMKDKKEIFQIGPYKLTDFQTDEYIILEAKENYWGKSDNNPFLQAHAKNIVFRIVPDEMSAVNMAKEGKLDFLSLRSSSTFLDLKNDEAINENWSFHVPQINRTYYLALNNQSPKFAHRDVRRGLAHLIDVDDVIENIDGGLGVRTTGPFVSTKSYYNKDLKPVPFDLEKAISLFEGQGWFDKNNDGIRERVIDGTSYNLSVDYYFTGSQLAKNIGLLMQETAKKAGVEIKLIPKKMDLINKENLSQYNYGMFASAITTDEAPDDAYSRFHSDNAVPGTRNIMGYANKEADKYIEEIRTTRDVEKRTAAYIKLQEILHEDQPCIFLYNPLSKFMINKNLRAVTTAKRPGYLANTFQQK